jgi:hypothetical protein
MSALTSPSVSLLIRACSSLSLESSVRMLPRWSQAITIMAPSLPQI